MSDNRERVRSIRRKNQHKCTQCTGSVFNEPLRTKENITRESPLVISIHSKTYKLIYMEKTVIKGESTMGYIYVDRPILLKAVLATLSIDRWLKNPPKLEKA